QDLAPIGQELRVVVLPLAVRLQAGADVDVHAVRILSLRRRRAAAAASGAPALSRCRALSLRGRGCLSGGERPTEEQSGDRHNRQLHPPPSKENFKRQTPNFKLSTGHPRAPSSRLPAPSP